MPHVRVVLVRPETAANVGAVARAMCNTGLTELTLVDAANWRRVEAWRSAWRAHQLLESARETASLAEALRGASYVAALSGRSADTEALDVRAMAAEVAALPAAATVALVFGPETSGLAGDELAACGRQVAIPSHPAQPSLNLAQAVMVTAYEVFRASARAPAPGPLPVRYEQKEAVLARLRAGLGLRGPRGARAFDAWRRLLHRLPLAPRELRLLDHVARMLGRPRRAEAGALEDEAAPARRAPPAPASMDAFEDVRDEGLGFSLPALKWRELLFLGALVERDGLFVRDPARPLPPFRRPALFPPDTRFRAERRGKRVHVVAVSPP